MPTDTDTNADLLISVVVFNLLTVFHIAYVYYHRTLWGNWVNTIATISMIVAYVTLFIFSTIIMQIPETSDLISNLSFSFGIIIPTFTLSLYGYSYYIFESSTKFNGYHKLKNSNKY
jgi:prepilin signal peptidase PulO-like enzyme (type II secretory pathway)